MTADVKYSSAKVANNAPIGSLTMPSHFRTEATRGFKRAWRNIGMTTVGPVTTSNPPKTAETGKLKPAMKYNPDAISAHPRGAPKTIMPNAALRVA